MKIFFAMTHPGYIRNFESTLRLLAERGHRVHLEFNLKERMGENRLLEKLCRDYPSISFHTAKHRNTAWLSLARTFRLYVDFQRYLDPLYKNAGKLRRRAYANLPMLLRIIRWVPPFRSRWVTSWLTRRLISIEETIPIHREIVNRIAAEKPDVVLLTPLVDFGSDQVEVIKAARALGVRSVFCVHSWDNLTNKGLIRVLPDAVALWNERQKEEAIKLHGVPASRVVVTGATNYDQWFSWKRRLTREEFCHKLELRADRPIILYLCSSTFIAPQETPFIEQWIQRVRNSGDPVLQEASILIRPHPQNATQWLSWDIARLSNVSVWPRGGSNPIDSDSRSDYFDSIFHSAAVVGVNTSAQIEAGIVGRPVFTILADEFQETQEGTLHFHHLLHESGGLLRVGRNIEEHLDQLKGVLSGTENDGDRNRKFLTSFVRPHGLDRTATPFLVDAIEELAQGSPVECPPARAGQLVLRAILYPLAVFLLLMGWIDKQLEHFAKRLRNLAGRLRKTAAPAVPQIVESSRAKRILFVMLHPGYLRYYYSTQRLLAEQGHSVCLAFNQPNKQSEDRLVEQLASEVPRVTHCAAPKRTGDNWRQLARFTRNLQDYLRYSQPRYAGAPLLRARVELRIPKIIQKTVRTMEKLSPASIRFLSRALAMIEKAIPSSRKLESFLLSRNADLLLVTPLVNMGSDQVDFLKSAKALGIPTGICVASWDNLTNKGLLRIQPDRVFLWNDIQKREAVELHGIDESRIVVTGAPRFDDWFARRPSRTRESLASNAGLDPKQPFIIYLCSSPFIGRKEEKFVEQWIQEIRGAADPAVNQLGILIRPHPQNAEPWKVVDFSSYENVSIWPREGANPVHESSRSDFFDCIYHSEAVVGLNTSAFLEAGILGVPAFTVLSPEFRGTQEGTLHFHYLLKKNGGLLHVSENFEEHIAALAGSQAHREASRDAVRGFIGNFLRPHGIETPSAPILAGAIEELLAQQAGTRIPERQAWWVRPLRLCLVPLAFLLKLAIGLRPAAAPVEKKKSRPLRESVGATG
ncbi:MAG: hypothetical protein ACKVX7_18600 [Planctomycetota bacterium]